MLAKYRHINEFVLVPDNDIPGHKYIEIVFREIQKACPFSKISVCLLPEKDKGDDLIDWIQVSFISMPRWDGFTPIAKSYSEHIKSEFLAYVNQNLVEAEKYFEDNKIEGITFEYPHEPIQEILISVLPCPMDTLPIEIVDWIRGFSVQMQISEDYLVVPFFVNIGSLIGRRRCLKVRQGTSWIEFPNAWGMLVGRSAMMKSPAMNAVINPLRILADRMFKKHQAALKQYQVDLETWKIRKKAGEEVYKRNFKATIEGTSEGLKEEVKFHVEDMPSEPRERRYMTQDATTAKLGELLLENPQGLLIYRDELSGWLKSFEKSGQENDRQFFLESWSGKQNFDVDRIGRGTLHISALCLSIFGSIQPGPLSQYVRSESHLTKYKKLLPTLCLILEHLNQALENQHPQIITIEVLKAALRWLDYFESHACRIYGSGANAVLKAANDLIKRLHQGDIKEPFTVRDVYYGKHWAGLATPEQVEEVLKYLIEKRYVGCKTIKTGGCTSTKYWVNPTVFEEMA